MVVNKILKKILLAFVCVALVWVNMPYSDFAYAAGNVTIEDTLDTSGTQGGKVNVIYTIKNSGSSEATIKELVLNISGGGLTISKNTSEIKIPANNDTTVNFTVSIDRNASIGSRDMTLTAKDADDKSVSSALQSFTIYEKFATDGHEVGWVTAVDVAHTIQPKDGGSVTRGNGSHRWRGGTAAGCCCLRTGEWSCGAGICLRDSREHGRGGLYERRCL